MPPSFQIPFNQCESVHGFSTDHQCRLLQGELEKNFTFYNSILLVFFFIIVCAKHISSFLKIFTVPKSTFASSTIWLIDRCLDRRYFSGLEVNVVSPFYKKLFVPFYLVRALFRQFIGGSNGFFFLYLLFYFIARELNFDSLKTTSLYFEIGVNDDPWQFKFL